MSGSSSNNSTSGGVGILGVLLIVFIVLKLVGVITWSWFTVLIPLWISLGIIAIFLLVIGVVAVVVAIKK